MEVVNTTDAILYGFKQIATALLIVLLGLFFVLIGIAALIDSPVLGILLALLGFGIVGAGSAGLGYKVISDAVATGRVRSETKMGTPRQQAKKVERSSQAQKIETETRGDY